MKNESVIIGGFRTPMGSFQGVLAEYPATELGSIVLKKVLDTYSFDPKTIDEVFMGHVITAGCGQAPARQAAKGAGIPNSVGAMTINKVCGSSLKGVMLADQAIRLGEAQVILAGGMESMTRAPYLLPQARDGYRLGHGKILDGMIHDGLWDPYNDFHMGNAGERCARIEKVSRADQDAYAKTSYERAIQAFEKGWFKKEIVPVPSRKKKDKGAMIDRDEEPHRGYAKLNKMDTLPSVFEKNGTVTAANASKISDGAAAVLLTSAMRAKELQLTPKFRIVGYAQKAMAPEDFPIAPIAAIKALTEKTGIALKDVDRIEINEAFSVVMVVAIRQLELDPSKLNARGGAVAMGHPIGASGARILVTLMNQLEDEGLHRGIASLCIGGGEAIALMVERI